VTRGQGRVIASSKIQVIQNLEGGIVKEILVQTGDTVTQSQPLIKLDETQFKSDLAAMQQRLERLQAQSNAAIENFKLIQQEQDIVAPLVEKGVESQMELIRLKQRLNEAQSNILQIDAEIEATIETIPALKDKLERTLVRASMNAVVNRLLVNTVGGVVQPGSPMLELVPIDDELVVEVEISPKDIAYVIPGQRASIKLTAFDFAKFGALDGEVTKISADSISKEDGSIWYLCQVSVPVDTMTTLGKTIQIQTGMMAQVDIISGEKTVLEYLLQPVTKIANEAFRER